MTPSRSSSSRFRILVEADMPEAARRELIAAVRRRLAEGELDSDLARLETAVALLDGDPHANESS